ncbi:MAG: hypothetical protein CBC89_01590 [Euryarchaeota archaeon TMED129]|nr:MAG: hypothetical protein CBC89_01590 [Euryarchaeota archaeon TMED129]|tara:strand:- start:1250 stop:3052 length:1803 start_codon:yes stop_codon:yes gene_type:complete
MSRARGLITGSGLESRTSGMYDFDDNIRIASISNKATGGLRRVGMENRPVRTTGLSYPYSFAWSPDGLHLYIAYSGDYIIHYTVNTPFTDDGISTQATFGTIPYDTNTIGMEISPDGRYLYFCGFDRDTTLQFTMSTAFDIASTATNSTLSPGYEQLNKRLNNIFSIGSSDGSIRGCEFNADGTKFYLIGFGDDNVQQFTLSTAYAVGTASYDGAYNVGADGHLYPYNIRWNNDGTKMFVVDYYTDLIVEYSVSNAYDVTSGTITEGTNFATTSYESSPFDVAFNSDGTKMYVIGNGGDEVNEWSLSTGFDLSSTVTHVSATSLGLANPAAFDISPDGTFMAVVDYNSDTLKGFTLSTPFDSSTISGTQTIDLSTNQWPSSPTGVAYLTNYWVTPTGCRFNSDGTTITILDRYNSTTDKAVSVPLLVPYDIRSFADGTVDANTEGVASAQCCRFSPDGTKFYMFDGGDDAIYQWSLHTPYALGRGSTTANYDGKTASLAAPDAIQYSFDWTPGGKGIFVCGSNTDTISFWEFAVPYDVTSTITYGHAIDITGWETDPREIRVVNCYNANKTADGRARTAGYKLHVLGTGSDVLYEFDINF